MTLPPDLPDEFDEPLHWTDHAKAERDEQLARRIQWALIAAFVVAVIAGLSVS